MKPNYTRVELEDLDSILWLQLALARLFPGPGSYARVGELGSATGKALRLYQHARKLPVTGEPDAATLAQIRQELEQRGLTIP